MIELKPCPYCGKEAVLYKTIQRGPLYECEISCIDRYAMDKEVKGNRCLVSPAVVRYRETLKEAVNTAVEAWNTRPDPWHTGQPTEEGEYVIVCQYTKDGESHRFKKVVEFKDGAWDLGLSAIEIIEWQKIEL